MAKLEIKTPEDLAILAGAVLVAVRLELPGPKLVLRVRMLDEGFHTITVTPGVMVYLQDGVQQMKATLSIVAKEEI